MRIELHTSPGCPNAAAARRLLVECLTAASIEVPIIERVGEYPSPTLLIDGVDVMRPGEALTGNACRIDLPTRDRLLAVLRGQSPSAHTP